MNWAKQLLRIFGVREWRELATAPFDCEIALAISDSRIGVLDTLYLRHGDGWLDAQTLRPVRVSATHWRYRRPGIVPMSCC